MGLPATPAGENNEIPVRDIDLAKKYQQIDTVVLCLTTMVIKRMLSIVQLSSFNNTMSKSFQVSVFSYQMAGGQP